MRAMLPLTQRFVGIVAQEHDLGARLEQQRCFGRVRRPAEFTGDAGLIFMANTGQRIEVGLVDTTGCGIGRRQYDVRFSIR